MRFFKRKVWRKNLPTLRKTVMFASKAAKTYLIKENRKILIVESNLEKLKDPCKRRKVEQKR